MDTRTRTTWYISERIDLPLAAAATALDELVELSAEPSRLGALVLGDPGPAALPGAGRRLDGRLHLGGAARAVPVELELGAWSHDESELGLRPRRPLSFGRATRYDAAAMATLEGVAGWVEAIGSRAAIVHDAALKATRRGDRPERRAS